jgi:CRISPR system Cascade subunit CasE
MYLTRLTLDPRSAKARRDLGDAYEMHRTLVRAFVDSPQSEPPRFLWRLEASKDSGANPTVLVQSEVAADWSVLETMPNYLQRHAESKCVALDQLIRAERCYRFRLLANPTVTREGKRYGLLKESEQNAWIERQGERHGFGVQACLVSAQNLFCSRDKGKPAVCIHRVCFEGLLKVQNEDALKRALVAGIGPAKAFGCGLLSVAPC